MTTKMDRRTFLKGAAAAAAAVSLSGLLTGCGGDQELPDNAVQLGVFNVSIYGLNVDQGAELGGDAGAITGTVKIRFSDSGSSTQAVPGKTGRRIRCHQDGRLIGSRTFCPGHSGKSARGFLSFCPGAEGWFWAVFPAM